MRGSTCALVLLSGCATTPTSTEPPRPGVEPRQCAQQMSLVATSSQPPTDIGPLALDVDGVDLCFHLDPGMFTRARFDIASQPVPGPTSALAARLEYATFFPILDGDDETLGDQTRMGIDWLPPNDQPSDVVVWLRATDGEVSTMVSVSLFDPLD